MGYSSYSLKLSSLTGRKARKARPDARPGGAGRRASATRRGDPSHGRHLARARSAYSEARAIQRERSYAARHRRHVAPRVARARGHLRRHCPARGLAGGVGQALARPVALGASHNLWGPAASFATYDHEKQTGRARGGRSPHPNVNLPFHEDRRMSLLSPLLGGDFVRPRCWAQRLEESLETSSVMPNGVLRLTTLACVATQVPPRDPNSCAGPRRSTCYCVVRQL
jgi:hypothetical protein